MAQSQATTEDVQLVTADTHASHKKAIAPKTFVLHRVSNSFGFTLRHFVVYPPEVIRSINSNENRTVNGIDNEPSRGQPIDTIFVRQVSPNGPADKAGLSSGDQVVSVNGLPTGNKSYKQVIEIIQKSRDSVELGIVPKEECVLQLVSPVLPVNHPPPPTKPKPTEKPTTSITSTVKIPPTHSSHETQSSASLMVTISDPPDDIVHTVVTRRESIDRSAQENRNYVVSNKYDEVNNNSEVGRANSQESRAPAGGTYFFATTDYTGKPKALHFQRGNNLDQLQVVDQSKSRSKSLPCVELEGFKTWQEGRKQRSTTKSTGSQISINENSLEINISQPDSAPQCAISSSRVVASDSPSTVNVSTNSEFMARQPVATEPKRKPSMEESSSYLVRTISSHMNRERTSGGLQSSTVGATLLESQPTGDIGSPQPAKIPRQTNQVSVYTNQNVPEEVQLSISSESDDRFAVSRNQPTFEERRPQQAVTSPRHRRTSYLMATNAANAKSSTGAKPMGVGHGNIVKTTPTLSSALSSTFMTPMMVHVSSGTEICKDTPREDGPMDEVEIFVDNEAGFDDVNAPRLGRRISYVMATSSSSSSRITLEGMKEEEEPVAEPVPGLMEVIKEGFLWKKLVVGGGGKRSSVRSWKAVYCVLRGHMLYFHKDRDSAHHTKMGDSGDDQQPISIKSCIVDIAHDYTKRKNVFRLTTFIGCEYLFQCEDRSSMMKWIEAIQSNNNPDEDESGVTSQSLIIRRMRNVEQETTGSHSSGNKLTPTTSSAKIPNFSNLKKSLSFKNISGIQSKDEGSKTNKWNKSSKKRKNKPPGMASYVQGHSIGVPLEMCPMSKSIKGIPVLVEHCCNVVDNKGIECVGVYRVPGNSAAVSLLQDEINNKGVDNVNFEDEKWHDVNNITSLFKQFLRKLPEGLVTADLYEGFIEANKKEDPVERMWALKCLINELPEYSYETLKYLLAHLKRVADNAEKNKMEARNLAIVFGPTLVRTGEDTMISMVKDMSDQCRIVETLLTHNEWFFEESAEGDEPPSKPPIPSDTQDHFVSMSVLSSLGQAAGNFGDDGNMKSKSGSGLISLHIPKFRGRHSKSESHDSSSPEAVMSDGSVSPTLDRGPPPRIAAGSCPGSPTQERYKLIPKRSSDLTSLSTGSISPAVDVADDSKIRGTSSLKAYSYARPPPPSYRKVGPQKISTSDHPAEAMPVCVTFTGPTTPDLETAPKIDYDAAAHDVEPGGHPAKPTFASLSEETRLRLLKVSLHQKAMEKKRQSEGSSPGLSPSTSHIEADDTPSNKGTDTTEGFGSNEHLSSSNTSRSSSTPSSKTASLDSLHQSTIDSLESRKVYATRVTTSGGWKASLTPPQSTNTAKPSEPDNTSTVETSQTVVTVVQGKGVKNSAGEAKRRPSSSDIRARRNTAEGLRVRPAMQSESSDSSSDDEAGNLQLSMSKIFDEKLRTMFFDYSSKRDEQKKGDREEDSSSLSSEQSRRASVDRPRRSSGENSDQHLVDDIRSSTGSLPAFNAERRPSFEQRLPTRRRVSVDGSETRTTIQIESKPRKASMERLVSNQTPADRKPSLETSKAVINVDAQRKSSNPSSGNQRHSLPTQAKMGRIRTTTPVALKEFKIASATFRKDVAGAAANPQRKLAHKDSPIVKNKTEESTVTISPSPSPRNSYTSSTRSTRGSISESSPRNSFGESPRNSRSEVSINLSRSKKPPTQPQRKQQGKYAAMAARSHHVQPKVMGREATVKQKTFPRDVGQQRRDILPSKGRHATSFRDYGAGKEKRAHQLETNAQHIADLLEEMHTERLRMVRQRSDISGQAQKAAAQRAATRRRRRSVGDENEPNLKDLTAKGTDEEKDKLLKATHDVARYKWQAEQNEVKASQSSNKPLLTQPGNRRSKDWKD